MRSIQKKEFLSKVDRELLKVLLNPSGRSSSMLLSKTLGIRKPPFSTDINFWTKIFCNSRIDLLIATRHSKTMSVAKQLLSDEEVTYVGKSIEEHTIDLTTKRN